MNPVPLWPDWAMDSQWSRHMMRAKEREDGMYWTTMRQVLSHDFQTLPRDRFKVWASVWNVPFVHSHIAQDYVWEYLAAIHTSPYADLYREAAREPMIGCTRGDFRDYLSLFADSDESPTRVQHLAHLLICGFTPNKLKKMKTIVEFGSGIGEMPDIIRKLGFTGDYYIFDFPEVSDIQRWYHTQLGGHARTYYTDNPLTLPIADLCIGTWSLTEMPFDLRETLVSRVNLARSKNWLLAYSNQIFGMDNEAWVRDSFLPLFKRRKTRTIPIPHMPWNGGTYYLTVHS